MTVGTTLFTNKTKVFQTLELGRKLVPDVPRRRRYDRPTNHARADLVTPDDLKINSVFRVKDESQKCLHKAHRHSPFYFSFYLTGKG